MLPVLGGIWGWTKTIAGIAIAAITAAGAKGRGIDQRTR
jgi:hypothetical protein